MVNDYIEYLRSLIEVLPDKPGVYQFLDKEREIIYIGKAASLKKRVSSYFGQGKHEHFKLKVLVNKIADIKHIVVANESDSLLLENNLIKKYQPRYNVLLKDDKTFPWICVKKEPFPRVFSTRNVIKDGSVYYGPYTSGLMVRTILDLVRQLYPLRTCKYNLSQENIDSGKLKVCLEYHIGNCKAPCIGLQSMEDYEISLKQVHQILKGNIFQVVSQLKKTMRDYADNQQFEKAQLVKEKIQVLEKYRSKSTIVNPKIKNVDVYSIADEGSKAYVNCLRVVNGAIVQAHTLEMKKKLDETIKDLLEFAIVDIRQRLGSDSKEIIVPERISLPLGNVRIIVPQKGDKKQLLELSQRNVKMYQIEKRKQSDLLKPRQRTDRILNTVKKDLYLKEIPDHIECFDNSNIQGKEPVASCVVFRNARPSKKEYRHYNIKSITGADDFASMEEIIFRRYRRLLDEKQQLPQLIVVDGGKGQLNAAVKSLERLEMRGKVAIIGIAKKLEEIYFPNDSVPLYIDKNSETLKLIQQLRNEAHRFGITFHRDKRSKAMIRSELDQIKGIGEKSKEDLLKKFGSMQRIKKANIEEVSEIIGKKRAQIIKDYIEKSKI